MQTEHSPREQIVGQGVRLWVGLMVKEAQTKRVVESVAAVGLRIKNLKVLHQRRNRLSEIQKLAP
jgi:hypothetical protein